MNFKFRQELHLHHHLGAKRIVVKVGSAAITGEQGRIDLTCLGRIVHDLAQLCLNGTEVVLVTSGAISAGRGFLGSAGKKADISYLQACSAVGQPLLMAAYQKEFEKHGLMTAQVLLTHDDLKNRTRNLNTRNTILKLMKTGIIPILNENDSVSFEEITVGDNDQLAAMVTELIEGHGLVLLTGPDGLYDQDPSLPGAKHLPSLEFHADLKEIKTITKSSVGRGGMATKLLAVRKLTALGIPVIIGTYRREHPVLAPLCESVGTFFHPHRLTDKNRRKAWISTIVKNNAFVLIDEGACKALRKNASLLPIGIRAIQGTFKRGDVVNIKYQAKIIAVGISEYDSKDILQLMGKKSTEIASLLGSCPSDVIVHRDNMFIKD
ncbi:MAG: glutamate 5-kinase [Bdellovibrionales bacterium GWA2_49_15]|nr:MAG: glutamate 5-kinase [Bdellovibrionales bacterium GWA2_49_15]HAZ12852.1 glutamate 5-kinase [Bdellovibrionales bacterium]